MRKSKQNRLLKENKRKRTDLVNQYEAAVEKYGKDHVIPKQLQKKIVELDQNCK